MSFLDGLKTIWSNPEIRNTAIKSTVAAVAATGVATYAATRVATRKWRKESEAYRAEPKTTMIDGELYKKMPDGTLVPYSPQNGQSRNGNRNSPKIRAKQFQCRALPQKTYNVDVIYIKGRPFRIDEYGNYTPLKMIGK